MFITWKQWPPCRRFPPSLYPPTPLSSHVVFLSCPKSLFPSFEHLPHSSAVFDFCIDQACLRGCLHDTGVTFALQRVHSGSLSWLYICLHDTTTNVMPARATLAWVHPGSCAGARISLRYEISQRYHVNARLPPVSVWNRCAGRLEWVAHTLCLRFWITCAFYQLEVYLQITRCEMTRASCKHENAKSKTHPGTETRVGASFPM